jgi:hypothetical protein
MTRRPAVASKSGPEPNDVTRPKAPGRLATHKATVSIHSMPKPICRQKKASKPNGIATTPRMPMGMTRAETIGMASRFAITP